MTVTDTLTKGDPMWEWDSWSRNRGEFSFLSDLAFERHIANLYRKIRLKELHGEGFQIIEPLWY